MDISGPIRALLKSTAPALPRDAHGLFVQAVALNQQPDEAPPAFDSDLAIICGLWTWPCVAPEWGRLWELNLREAVAGTARPVSLWAHYVAVLAKQILRTPAPSEALNQAYRAAFQHGSRLPNLSLHDSPESAVYHELSQVHALYHAAALLKDSDTTARLQPVVQWHVEHTQPDHVSTQPWALAAFAALDRSGTFAPQQLHDVTVRLHGRNITDETAMTLAILADALLTMELPI